MSIDPALEDDDDEEGETAVADAGSDVPLRLLLLDGAAAAAGGEETAAATFGDTDDLDLLTLGLLAARAALASNSAFLAGVMGLLTTITFSTW
jgi:hypothetical protein